MKDNLISKLALELTDHQLELELRRMTSKERRMLNNCKWLLFVFLVVLAIVISTILWIPVYHISENSMAPILKQGETVAGVYAYEFKTGDLVAISFKDQIYFRRIIGIPGDHLSIALDGNIMVNDKVMLNVDFLQADLSFPYLLPEDCYFVLADNQTAGYYSDMPVAGCIERDKIASRIILRIWPVQNFGYVG